MTACEMPADQFWKLMDHAARFDDDPTAHMNALAAELRGLTPEDIKSFEVAFRR